MLTVQDLLANSDLSGNALVVFVDEYQTEIARGHMRCLRCAARTPETCHDYTLSVLLGCYAKNAKLEVLGPYIMYVIKIIGAW